MQARVTAIRASSAAAWHGCKQGDEVKKGDLIFQIEPRAFEVALNQANAVLARDVASLQNAEADMRRTDELASTKAVSASAVDVNRAKVASFRATVDADKAAVEIATVQLSYCSIRSPINGERACFWWMRAMSSKTTRASCP